MVSCYSWIFQDISKALCLTYVDNKLVDYTKFQAVLSPLHGMHVMIDKAG